MRPLSTNSTFDEKRQGGLSLVELLIAMTLGLILISGVLTIFSSARKSASINTTMAQMQESMRFVMNAMAGDIRMAGHQGCFAVRSQSVDIIAKSPPTQNLTNTAISGAVVQADDSWLPALALGAGTGSFTPPTVNKAIVGTHTLAVQFGGPSSASLLGPLANNGVPSTSGVIEVEGDLGLQEFDLAILSTCEGGELFRVSSVVKNANGDTTLGHNGVQNDSAAFAEIYGAPSSIEQTRIMPFSTHIYYIGDTGQNNKKGDVIRGLYQQSMPFNDTGNPPVLLVAGVESMQISFGVGSAENSGQLQFVDASNAAFNASQIRSVRIGILMVSTDEITNNDDVRTYLLAGNEMTPASATSTNGSEYQSDKRFRLVFNTTVSVRNRQTSQ